MYEKCHILYEIFDVEPAVKDTGFKLMNVVKHYILFDTMRPEWNGHLADDIFKCIFLNFLIEISLKDVDKCPVDSKLSLAQVMAWYQTGYKPSPDPMLTQAYDNVYHYGIIRPPSQFMMPFLWRGHNELNVEGWKISSTGLTYPGL